jgi:PAS domain-containing protein
MTAVPHEAIARVDVFAFTVRVDAAGSFAWLYFGPNSETVFGSPVTDALPLPRLMREHAGAEDRATIDAFLEAVAAGQRTEIEIRLAGVDGTTRWVSWRAVPRELGGQLFVDGVATDVTARHSLGTSLVDLEEARDRFSRELDVRREHTLAVRDATDNVLQRLFAAGLRLQMLQRRLDTTDAHAASAIGFQLDQAATDLRSLIHNLNAVVDEMAPADEREVAFAS